MKYVKLPKDKDIQAINENTLTAFLREGFVECDEKGKIIEVAEPQPTEE